MQTAVSMSMSGSNKLELCNKNLCHSMSCHRFGTWFTQFHPSNSKPSHRFDLILRYTRRYSPDALAYGITGVLLYATQHAVDRLSVRAGPKFWPQNRFRFLVFKSADRITRLVNAFNLRTCLGPYQEVRTS